MAREDKKPQGGQTGSESGSEDQGQGTSNR